MKNLRQAISAAYLADEDSVHDGLTDAHRMAAAEETVSEALARDLGSRLRASGTRKSGVDALTQEYALSSEEGVVLMCLAEARLRVPGAEPQDRLIRDKIAGRAWESHLGHSQSLFVNASTWALMLTGQVVEIKDTSRWDFDAILRRLAARLGEPVIRQAVVRAVKLLGRHFVLGRTIEEALKEARPLAERGYRFSFDMLGEAAVTRGDAARYLERYREAVHAIARAWPSRTGSSDRPGISVKLTALHPRFDSFKRRDVMLALIPPLPRLCAERSAAHLVVTIDAEEAE